MARLAFHDTAQADDGVVALAGSQGLGQERELKGAGGLPDVDVFLGHTVGDEAAPGRLLHGSSDLGMVPGDGQGNA